MNIEKKRPNPEMVSSTGSIGLERRSYDRLYWNWRGQPVESIDHLASAFYRLGKIAEQEGRTRTVFRGLFTEQAYEELLQRHADFPTETVQEISLRIHNSWTEDPVWFVVLGRNAEERRAFQNGRDYYQQLVRNESNPSINFTQRKEEVDIRNAIHNVLTQRFAIRSEISDSMIDNLVGLWRPTFEWTAQGVHDLQTRLLNQKSRPKELREVWFSGLQHKGKLIAAATAERIDFRRDHRPLTFVENTEWVTDQQYRGRGLMTGLVSHLNAQILNDLGPDVVIYAECNWLTKAFYVGKSAGMVMPQVNSNWGVYQILRQNVAVGDGLEPSGLRDFVFMYLPQTEIMRSYQGKKVFEVLQMTK